jgi:hypothetical protein
VLPEELAESPTLAQLAHDNQADAGGDSGILKIDLHKGVEGELKGLVLFITLGVSLRSTFIASKPA